MKHLIIIIPIVILLTGCQPDQPISFNRDIRPILNEKCMSCHGGVKAMGGFNLLFETTALGETESGRPAIVPGNHRKSELYQRITSVDPELRMPLDADPLTKQEIGLIRQWIDEGARWEKHWAYIHPDPNIRPPEISTTDWPRHDLDRFVLATMQQHDLQPNPEAGKVDLMRRLYFDLTGLPPDPEEAMAFLTDETPEAYEKLVDQLLASPHFGERWATMWLDLARYADTKGYEKDSNRSIWRYRDWVIDAFNKDMPFDQFTIEQLAGDLLDHPTISQLTATAFHRNSIANDEGGTDDEMFRIASVIERVGTTYEVWQATTMACVQCHSHPFDPFLQKEFYQSMAFFNNAVDRDIYNEQPKLFTYKPENADKVKSIINWVQNELPAGEVNLPTSDLLYDQRTELLTQLGHRVVEAEEYTRSSPLIELIWPDQDMLWQIQDTSWIYFRDVDLGRVEKIGFRVATALDFAGTIEIRLHHPNGPKLGQVKILKTADWPGWQASRPTEPHLFREYQASVTPTEGKHDLYFRFTVGDTYIQHLFYLDQIIYYESDPIMARYGQKLKQKLDTLAAIPAVTTPIIQELPAERSRVTRIFERGSWLMPGDTVQAAIPGIFANDSSEPAGDRLAFARRLVSPENPLTARVIVNRIWEQLFGSGIVSTMEEFGSQGADPSHPELLDWLAVRLRTVHQWRLKPLIRELVLSATYRQDSAVDPEKLEKDSDNIWLARGIRVRLSAEQIRDQILALSGLLDRKIGGPSVILPELDIRAANIPSWAITNDAGRYRRTLYTFWKRTDPFPDMIVFDSPDRAVCSSQRIPTNTPLQALNLLNDEVYFEAARSLARRIFSLYNDPGQQIAAAYKAVLFREPQPEKKALLFQLYQQSLSHFRDRSGEIPAGTAASGLDKEDRCRLEALSMVANALFNLDELIVKS